MSTTLNVPRRDLGSPCCVTGCGQQAAWWVGPTKTNGLDDYTEVCSDHVEDVKGPDDVAVRL